MFRRSRKMMIALSTGMVLFASCSNEANLYNPDEVVNNLRNNYAEKWTEKFGTIDPTQDWNSATQVTANISLGNLPSSSYNVRIFTENPANATSFLLAKTDVKGSTDITFDAPKGLHSVFVTATGDEGKAINGYFSISKGKVQIGRSATRASGTCPTTIGEHTVYREGDKSETLYQLVNPVIEEGYPWRVGELKELFNPGTGYFAEGVNNVEKYDGNFSGNVQYVMQEAGPVTLQFNYMITSGINAFGYYYWKEGEDPAGAKKLIITNKNMNEYLQYGNWDENAGAYVYQQHRGTEPQLGSEEINDDTMFKGSIFNLVYFDEAGNGSFTFPAGTHIAFFIENHTDPNVAWPISAQYKQIFNSIADYNKDKNNIHPLGKGDDVFCYDHAVTFNYKGTTILGFEDWCDFDENDLVFFATGNFEKPDVVPENDPEPEPDPEAISWFVACEDLGSTGDYDFNDIVFSVSHLPGATTATIVPLAAGGVLSAHILYNNVEKGEIHHLIQPGVTTDENGNYPMLNTTTKGAAGLPLTIEVPTDFSMAEDMGGFSILVDATGNGIRIGAPTTGTAPQMLVMPGPWAWPLERHRIENAYPDFAKWNQAAVAFPNWYETQKNEAELVK